MHTALETWKQYFNKSIELHKSQLPVIIDSSLFKLILKGIIHSDIIQLGINFGLSKDKSRNIAIKTGKKIIKLVRDTLWKPRCDTQIKWEKANNISAINKKSNKTKNTQILLKQVNTANTNASNNNTKHKSLSHKDILKYNSVYYICGIPEHKHTYSNYNNIQKLKHFADKYIRESYIDIIKGSEVISINM